MLGVVGVLYLPLHVIIIVLIIIIITIIIIIIAFIVNIILLLEFLSREVYCSYEVS